MNAFASVVFLLISASAKSEITTNFESFESGNETTHIPLARIKYPYPGNADEVSQFVSNYNSYKSVAVLVDDTLEARQDASKFMNKLFESHHSARNIEFLLMEFNSSGVSGVLETSKNNIKRFQNLISDSKSSEFIGCLRSKNKTLAFYAILKAAQVLENNCGILLFVDQTVDENVLQIALQAAQRKYIRVFVHWGNPDLRDTNILRDASKSTRGQFYVKRYTNLSIQNHREFIGSCLVYKNASLLVSKKNLTGETTLDFRIDSNITGIHVIITPYDVEGVIITSTGQILNLSDQHQVASFSRGSYSIQDDNTRNIQLDLKLLAQNTGIWKLKLQGGHGFYNVTAVGLNRLDKPSTNVYKPQLKDAELENENYVNRDNSRRFSPTQPIYVDVGLGSELITIGGRTPEIFFEVTNFGNSPVDARFYVTDLQYILWSMQPVRKILGPQETTIVRLTLRTKIGTYQDDITFSVSTGAGSVQKKVVVDVGTSVMYDNKDPDLDYQFTSDCTSVLFSRCEHGSWSVEVWGRDTGSGLLQVTSNPRGLYFPYGFITGTKERVTGYYSESCCNPDLQVIVIDRANNRRQWHLNAYWTVWSAGAIAALILGILLLLIIIICLIVWLVRRKKQKGRYDLPTYKGGKI